MLVDGSECVTRDIHVDGAADVGAIPTRAVAHVSLLVHGTFVANGATQRLRIARWRAGRQVVRHSFPRAQGTCALTSSDVHRHVVHGIPQDAKRR